MKRKNGKIIILNWFILFIMIFVLNSCYSDYLSINYDAHYGAVRNTKGNKIAFVASKTAYRKAKGITSFPDGGIPKYLMVDMGLYILDTTNLKLTEIVDFRDLVRWEGSSKSKWKVKIAFADSLIYYQIELVTEWSWFISKAKTDSSAHHISLLKQKYDSPFLYNLNKKSSSRIDTTKFKEIYSENFKLSKVGLTELNKILKKVPLSDWGLLIQEIYPKSEMEYIKETIYCYNNSEKTRQAVIEQIIAKKSNPEIEAILKKMDEHRNSLENLEKTEYEMYSKETYERIKALL